MDAAEERLRIQTPNLNDDAPKDAILRAVARGVPVELIISIAFNDTFDSLLDNGGQAPVKYTSVDGQLVIIGSTNRTPNPGTTRVRPTW